MGFLNKIKTILFEDDESSNMPDYSQEEVNVEINEEQPKEEKKLEPIKSEDGKFRSIKRDIDLYPDEDIIDEIPRDLPKKEEPVVEKETIKALPKEENNIFQNFDVDEFENSYGEITRNEEKYRKEEIKKQSVSTNVDVRKANSNYSSTTTKTEEKESSKKFKPSPVLSPVFGVLNVNYTKEDIVDRKDGIKREKLTPIKKEKKKELEIELPIEVDIDSVRKKAYGELEDMEKAALEETSNLDFLEKEFTSVDVPEEVKEEVIVEEEPPVQEVETQTVEEILDKVEEVEENVIPEVREQVFEEEDSDDDKPRLLDELEKTSTLQILDDIEKELNAIKPNEEEEDIVPPSEPSIEKSDTLENDLFNLIDSMYSDEGEDLK